MKNAWRLALSIGASSFLAAAVWALPPKAISHPGVTHSQDATQLQSASGKIASVRSNSFTLEAAENAPPPGQQLVQDKSHPKTMTFLIDKNTTVDGKLTVGASADVTYRQDNGNNVAVSVRVAP
jgi:hypothetical protein